MKTMMQFGLAVAVLGVVLGAADQARAGLLLGDSVNAEYQFPSLSTPGPDEGTFVINPVATYSGLGGVITSVVHDTQIDITFSMQETFTALAFNGTTFTDVSRDPGITGATLTSTTVSGFDASRVSFTSNSVSLNWQGLGVVAGDTIVVDLSGGSSVSAVPEPSTIVSASIAGLAALGYAWRRRKAKIAA